MKRERERDEDTGIKMYKTLGGQIDSWRYTEGRQDRETKRKTRNEEEGHHHEAIEEQHVQIYFYK